MLGPIGSNLINILKVLTPAEIERYSEEGVVGESRQVTGKALAAGAELLDQDGHYNGTQFKTPKKEDQKAKILPFRKDFLDEPEEDPYAGLGNSQSESNNNEEFKEAKREAPPVEASIPASMAGESAGELEAVGILSHQKIKQIELENKKKIEANQDSASVFLLKQRRKLQASKSKLVEQTAIANYQKSLQEIRKPQVEVDELEEEDDLSSSPSSGVLLNKKLY